MLKLKIELILKFAIKKQHNLSSVIFNRLFSLFISVYKKVISFRTCKCINQYLFIDILHILQKKISIYFILNCEATAYVGNKLSSSLVSCLSTYLWRCYLTHFFSKCPFLSIRFKRFSFKQILQKNFCKNIFHYFWSRSIDLWWLQSPEKISNPYFFRLKKKKRVFKADFQKKKWIL